MVEEGAISAGRNLFRKKVSCPTAFQNGIMLRYYITLIYEVP